MMIGIFREPCILTLAFILPWFASCASMKPLSLSDAQKLAGKSIVKVERSKPDFLASTADKAAVAGGLGPIGSGISTSLMTAEGNSIVANNGIEDPANWISEELLKKMERKYGLKRKGSRRLSVNKTQEIADSCRDADYALDVATTGWSFSYFPFNWATYWVGYSAQFRMIDCKTGAVVAQDVCGTGLPEKNSDSPSYKDLMRDGAARLKKELKIGAQKCLSHFQAQTLGL